MHLTLHTTSRCNMNCGYCYVSPAIRRDMTEDTVRKAIDFISSISPRDTGIIFFGGEPLLRKDLIETGIDYCTFLKKKNGYLYHFKVTTNGLLLDENFLGYCSEARLSIGLSFDGIKTANDYHRITTSGNGTFDILDDKIKLLLRYQPYASIYMVITPETVRHYYDSIKYLYGKGVKYIVTSLNYAGKWNDVHLAELKMQYKLLAGLYKEMTQQQIKFYFSPFEMKLDSHIKSGESACHKCHLGLRQLSVSPDGLIYPCVQFVDKNEFVIGDVEHGLDLKKRNELHELSSGEKICGGCALNNRCNNSCSCLNLQTTGAIDRVSPIFCQTEQILTKEADKLGNYLFKKKEPMFIQKHYNAVYPALSFFEDNLIH